MTTPDTSVMDPELHAVATVLAAIDGLDRNARRRVLDYVSERLKVGISFEVQDFMASLSAGLDAINQAAAKLSAEGQAITGAQLIAVVSQMYEKAVEEASVVKSD